MLEYSESAMNTSVLAVHYAEKIGSDVLVAFMKGEYDIRNDEDAELIIGGFWEMTDLAILDSHNDVVIHDISDIEYWMHKLFNKVGDYLIKRGYKSQWEKSLAER